MENKRGLSNVVSTLLIILLVLLAVGIIWSVTRGVLESGSQQFASGARCLQVNLELTRVVPIFDTGTPPKETGN